MTDLLVRPEVPTVAPTHPASAHPARSPRPYAAGLLAAVVANACGLAVVEVVVLALGLGDGRSTATSSDALHVGAAVWLLAQGFVLHLPAGPVSLMPLGLTAGIAVLLHQAGRAAARRVPDAGRRGVPVVALSVALPQVALMVLLALVVGNPDVRVALLRGALVTVVLGTLAAGAGAVRVLCPDRFAGLRRGGRLIRLSGPAPTPLSVALRGALAACGVLAVGASLLAGLTLAVHMSAATDLAADTDAGLVGHSGVLAVQLALVPNLAIWFLSYVVGPGFSVGADTTVGLIGSRLGEVPALPMLGGLPGPLSRPLLVAVCLIPVLAGAVAGRIVAARLPRGRRRTVFGTAGLTGVLAGVLVLIAVSLASGSVLGGGLAHIGAVAWEAGVAVAVEVGLVASVTLLAAGGWRRLRAGRADGAGPTDGSGAHRRGSGNRRRRFPSLRRPTLGWPAVHRPTWLRLPSIGRRRRRIVELPD